MTSEVGTTYPFAQDSPVISILRKATALSVILGTVLLTAICIAGALPLVFLPFGELLLVVTAVGTYYFGSIQIRRGFVVVTPSHFVVKSWLSGQTVPWDNVSTVTVASFKPKNSFSRGFIRLVYGGDADMTFVKIGLRRSRAGRVPGILKVLALYRWGVTGILKVMTLYLEEPEEFVERAQQFIVMTPPPAMPTS